MHGAMVLFVSTTVAYLWKHIKSNCLCKVMNVKSYEFVKSFVTSATSLATSCDEFEELNIDTW